MLSIIILEDDLNQLYEIEEIVKNRIMINPTPHEYDMRVDLVTPNPDEVVRFVQADQAYCLITDIDLKHKLSGIDVAEIVRNNSRFSEIIFVTAFGQYLPLTISRHVESLDFIFKSDADGPMPQRLRETVDEAYGRYLKFITVPERAVERIVYHPTKGLVKTVDVDQLFYIQAVKGKSRLIQIVGKNLHVETHGELANYDDTSLVKVNRGIVLNPANVVELDVKNPRVYFDKEQIVSCDISIRHLKELRKHLDEDVMKWNTLPTWPKWMSLIVGSLA